jgi:hypothetical protein
LATVLEEYITEEQLSVGQYFFFFVGKGHNTKDILKAMFPVYGGKCLSRKAVHNRMAIVSVMTKRFKWRCRSG